MITCDQNADFRVSKKRMNEFFEEDEKKKRVVVSFKPDIYDLLIIAAHTATVLLFWYFLKKHDFSKIHFHKSAIKNYAAAKKSIFRPNVGKQTTCFPIYPILLKIFWKIPFLSENLCSCILCLALDNIAGYVLRRFLQSFSKIKMSPVLVSLISAVYPASAVYLRSMDSEYSLFIILFCLLYINKFAKKKIVLYIIEFLIIWSSSFGLLACIGLTISLFSYGCTKDAIKTASVAAASFIGLLFLHKVTRGNAFVMFDQVYLDNLIPFKKMMKASLSISNLREFHGYYGYFIIPFLGAFTAYDMDKGISVFCLAGLVIASCHIAMDYFGNCAFVEAIAIFFGYTPLFSSKQFKNASYVIIPLVGFSMAYLEANKVSITHSNVNLFM